MNNGSETNLPEAAPKKRRKRTELERHLVFAKTGGRCFYCWDELDFWWDFVCDHFVPLSKSGADDHSNLVPACKFCDNRKGHHLPTPQVCAWIKKWKHEGLQRITPRIDLPLPVGKKAARSLGIERSQKNRKAITRAKDKLTGFIPNPVLPWNILGNHTNKLYAERGTDCSVEKGTEGSPPGIPGGDPERGLHDGGSPDLKGCAVEQGTDGQGGAGGSGPDGR